MKKRALCLLLTLVMVLSLLPFSAMAQVYPVTGETAAVEVKFFKGEEEISAQRVSNVGTEDHMVPYGELYDPGCPVESQEVFLGWQIEGQTGMVPVDAESGDSVRSYVNANYNRLSGKTLKVNAITSAVRYLVYKDESDRVVKTEAVIYARNDNSWETTVDFDYDPTDVNKEFYGWQAGETSYSNGSRITLDAAVTELTPICKPGYWVTFDESDKWEKDGVPVDIHATYQPPVFVEEGESFNPNSGDYNVSAQGYAFDGWYDADGNRVNSVSEAATVYAKWTAQTVKYKIAYWQQNANDDEYSIVASSITEATGTAGDFATYDKTVDPYDHFTLNESKTDAEKVIIAGDGSTVKNVYFDRDTYTLTFGRDFSYRDTGKYYVTVDRTFYLYKGTNHQTNVSASQEVKFDPGIYEISTFEGLYYYRDRLVLSNRLEACVDGSTFHYNYRSLSNYDSWNYSSSASIVAEKEPYGGTIYETITAKYGQYIGDHFPITGNGASSEWRWDPQNSSKFENVLVYIDTMPGQDTTFERDTSNASLKYIQFYVEPAPGETGTERYNGEYYAAYHDRIPAKYNFFTEAEDFVDLYGYEHAGSSPAFSDGRADVSSGGTLKLFYKRNVHTLSFDTGDTNKPADQSVKYDVPMSAYAPQDYTIGETTRTRNGHPIIFQGWYDNNAYAGEPYDFASEKMPDADVMLYAKWADARYAVQLNTNGGQMPEGATTYFKVEYNGTVLITANPTREGYEFAGWYTDEACTQRFNLDTHLTDATVKEAYTDPSDPTVKGRLTLYAKWRHEMDTDTYLTVVYDAGNGTISNAATYTDPLHYADQAEAIAMSAPVPPAGYTFSHWKVLGADGNPTSVTVKPGDIFNVKLDDADANKVVTLAAEYVSAIKTHITWFGNGGTTADGADTVTSQLAQRNAETDIMPADTFQREGYVFLGWARLKESDMQDGDSWTPTDSDSATDAAKQNMFLSWNVDENAFHVNSDLDPEFPDGNPVATAVSANDLPDWHVLYAVWQKIETVTYVADFNAKMKLAENAAIADAPAPVEKNGDFTVDNSKTAYYQFNQLSSEKKLVNGGVSLAFDGVDSARITGKFYAENTPAVSGKAAAASTTTKNVNVVPASSVYFDDDLVNETVTVGDGSGYNASIQASSPDAVNVEPGVYRFTFKGTGIDIYCTTYLKDADGTEAWFAQAKVDNGKVQTMAHQSGTVRYNVPTFTFRDLPYGEHTLVMNITSATNYKLDGIRVYGAVNDQSVYENTHEQYATFISMRETLVNNASTYDVFTNEMTKEQIGSLFVDSVANMSLYKQPVSGRTGEPIEGAEPVQVYADKFEAYQKNSPKHEIYLDTNQAIVFALTENGYNAAAAGNLWIGLSAPDKGTGTGTVTLIDVPKVQTIDVTSGVDMYYPITTDMIGDDNVVTIKNTGNSLISVTNLKITGNEDIYNAAHPAPAAGSDTPDSTANPARVFQMVFAPITMQTVKVAANGGVDPDAVVEPDVPEQPDVPDAPEQPGDPTDPTATDPTGVTTDPTDPTATAGDPTNPTATTDDPTEPTTTEPTDPTNVTGEPTDPGAPSDPGTPDEPDNGKPGWNDDAFNPVSVLRALFKLLMQSLSSLFNGLGDW